MGVQRNTPLPQQLGGSVCVKVASPFIIINTAATCERREWKQSSNFPLKDKGKNIFSTEVLIEQTKYNIWKLWIKINSKKYVTRENRVAAVCVSEMS